ncbi:MAG: hypothetical protein ACI9TH_000072 [Kiritimatiellia bacterium]
MYDAVDVMRMYWIAALGPDGRFIWRLSNRFRLRALCTAVEMLDFAGSLAAQHRSAGGIGFETLVWHRASFAHATFHTFGRQVVLAVYLTLPHAAT